MTLVTAINVEPGFAIMTTDTRKVFVGYWHDRDTKEYIRDEDDEVLEVSEEKFIKVRYLSKYVMMGNGGTSDLCLHISKKMEEVVKQGDDLVACGKKLTKLIEKMRGHPNPPSFFSFLDQENGIFVILNGFTRNGDVGMVFFESGPSAEVRVSMSPPDCTQYSMIPPDGKYLKHSGLLSRGVTDGTKAYEAAVTLHAQISLQEPIKVSPECHYFILSFGGGQVKKIQGDFDTSLLYEHVKDHPLE